MRNHSSLIIACLLGHLGCIGAAPDEAEGGLAPEDGVPVDDEGSTVDDAGNETEAPADVGVIASAYPAVTVASSVSARGIVKADSYLYFTTSTALLRVPTTGGTPVKIATSLNNPYGLAVDSTNFYWAESGTSTNPTCRIRKMPRSGGTITTLYKGTAGCRGLTLDSIRVYWTNGATGQVGSINKGGSGLIVRTVGGNPADIEVQTGLYNFVIWTNPSRGSIEIMPYGINTDLKRSLIVQEAPTHMRLSGDYVYWTNHDHGTVKRMNVLFNSPSDPVLTLATGQAGPRAIDVSGSWVYWTNNVTGTVMKMHAADGTYKTRIATVQLGADRLIVRVRASRTPPSLYWTNPTVQKIMKIDQY